MLLIGPPGSGKSTRILGIVEAAVRAGRSDEVRLLVPTASMRNHVVSTLAKRSLLVPHRVVETLSEYVSTVTPELKQAGPAVADRLLRAALREEAPQAFGAAAASVGLRGRIAGLIDEFWAAGCDNLQAEAAVRMGTDRQRAFLAVFRAHEEALEAEGLVHRNQRINRAAAAVRRNGLGPVRQVLLDGFDRFTKPQAELIGALAEQAEEILIAMPDQLPQTLPDSFGVEHLPARPGRAAHTETVEALSPRHEIEEVARRILQGGRPFRDHGVVLRSLDAYEAPLRAAFGALDIPFRIWGSARLLDHGVAQHFLRWLRLIARRFPGEAALEALCSPLTPAGPAGQKDAFDFAVREILPGAGLEFLQRRAAGQPAVGGFLAGLEEASGWHRRRFGARRWARECRALLPLVQALPVPVDGGSFRRTLEWRTAVRARRGLAEALGEVPALPEYGGHRRISLGEFADALEDVLRFKSLSERDDRFDVVHVLPVHEARQWSLPVTFVCGLADGWFPRQVSEEGLFGDDDRQLLKGRGIDLRLSAERAEEERFLYRVATTRATELLVRSYPLHDALGRPQVRSPFLDAEEKAEEAPGVRLEDREGAGPAVEIEELDASLREEVEASNQDFTVSGIDDFRQCPHLYFSRHTLALQGRPPLPERRLDAAQIGTIVHKALDVWSREGTPIGTALDETFRAKLAALHLDETFRSEQLRIGLRADLERFASERGARMGLFGGASSSFEVKRELRLHEVEGGPTVHCRIDRCDFDDQRRCVVTDYKYAGPQRVKDLLAGHLEGERVQLPLYLASLQQQLRCEPAGMALCGLRGETCIQGVAVDGAGGLDPVSGADLKSLVAEGRAAAAAAVSDVLQGSIAVRPRDRKYCEQFCDYRNVCRIRWSAPADGEDAAGGGAECN